MKSSIITGVFLAFGIVSSGVASVDVSLPTNEILQTSTNLSINRIVVPSMLRLEDGRIASGPQNARLINNPDSDNPLVIVGSNQRPVTLQAGDSIIYNESAGGAIIRPGYGVRIDLDLDDGSKETEIQVRPLGSTHGDSVKYDLILDDIQSVWDKSGWQVLYSSESGCKFGFCPSKKAYGSFDTVVQVVKYAAEEYCSGSGYRLKGSSCIKESSISPYERCSYGYTKVDSKCVKTTQSDPVQKCPNSKYKSGSQCFDTYRSSCPSTHYLSSDSTDGHCYPNSVTVPNGQSCPASYPYAGTSNNTDTTCFSVDTNGGAGRNARVESWCKVGDVGGGGYRGMPWCYNPSKGSASEEMCKSGVFNSTTRKCESILVKETSLACNSGTLTDGVCKSTYVREVEYRCSNGDLMNNRNCEKVTTMKKSVVESNVKLGTTLLKVRNSKA